MNKELRNMFPQSQEKHRGETGATNANNGINAESIDLEDMGANYSKFISFL